MFPAQTDLAAREIVIAITGQSSSTEITEGQDTGATLHGIVRQDLIEADAATLDGASDDEALEEDEQAVALETLEPDNTALDETVTPAA